MSAAPDAAKEAGCNCGMLPIPRGERIRAYDVANPGKSTREAAAALGGISHMAVNRARQAVTDVTPDDRPTIDNGPKGALWDDQNDREEVDDTVEKRVIGKDGKS